MPASPPPIDEPGSPRPIVLLHRPWINHAETDAVVAVLVSEILVAGPKTRELEARFAEYVGAAHAVAVSSGRAGLHLALDTVGVGPGDDVITSVAASLSLAAAIDQLGARPVLVDVDPVHLTLDPRAIERHLTPRTRAIVPVHFAGMPCEMDAILALAARGNVRVVEDASHALGARYRGRRIGSAADVSVFCFNPARPMTTGEGGILTTDHADYAERWRAQRADGIPEPPGTDGPPAGAEARVRGYGYRMTEMSAALGIVQLARLPRFHGIRGYYASLYQLGLGDLPELTLPAVPPHTQPAWDLYIVRVDLDRLTIDRDGVLDRLLAERVGAGVQFVPLYTHAYYRDTFGYRADDFPHAARAYARAISLPLYPRMTEADVWHVVQAVRRVVSGR